MAMLSGSTNVPEHMDGAIPRFRVSGLGPRLGFRVQGLGCKSWPFQGHFKVRVIQMYVYVYLGTCIYRFRYRYRKRHSKRCRYMCTGIYTFY